MPRTSSLWRTLDKKPKTPLSSTNLYALLKERSKIENERPDRIDHAHMERVVEQSLFTKVKAAKLKKNILNVNYFVLKNPKTNEYFRLNEQEKFLWNYMDGTHTIRDLALEYFNKYGAFAYDKIVELVFDLKQKTFLEEEYVDLYRDLGTIAKSKKIFHRFLYKLRAIFTINIPLTNGDRFFDLLYQRFFKVLYLKPVQYILIGVALIGFVVFLTETVSGQYLILTHNESVTYGVILLFAFNIASLFLHELAHGVTTKYFGRHVLRAGFLLYFGWPSFYVDTTDMWLEEKKKRIAASFAGPVSDVLLAGIISIIIMVSRNTAFTSLLYKGAFVLYTSVFINLNPLIEWDGYFVFMDLVGIPCLRRRSLYFVRKILLRKLQVREQLNREEKFYTIFGILSFIWSVIAVFLAIHFWQRELSLLF